MKQEAVAYAWCKNGKMLSAMIGKYEPIKTDPYWLENGFDAIPLYTAPRELEERIKYLEGVIESALGWVQAFDRHKPFTDLDACGEMVKIRLTGLCILATAIGKRDYDAILKKASEK